MSTDASASGATDDTSGDDQDNATKGVDASGKPTDTVAHATYKKTVDEVKKLKEQLRLRDEKLSKAEQEKLEAEGKKDELIASLKSKNSELETSNKKTLNNFIFSSLDSQVREEAARLGCVDTDAVVKLADLTELEVSDKTFKADKGELTKLLEKMKKDKPYLFSKTGPKINTKMPNGKSVDDNEPAKEKEDLSKLSVDEIKKRIKDLDKSR